MKRDFFLFALLAGMMTWSLTSCEKQVEPTPPTPTDTIPSSFAKKQLIEEFTGQDCGYCPYGMDAIHDFIGTDTNYVLVLHHYGYQADHFSVAGSKTITSALSVDGAPSVSVNRAKTRYGTSSAIVFHPGYFEQVNKSQYSTTTYASVNITNNYDASSRQLNIHISGLVGRTDVTNLTLTVLVKESGMVDYQADYYNTFEGWQEFRHCNAVRVFASAAKGDVVTVENQRYSADYSVTLKDSWVAENCMVVAFLSEEFKPVIQAEQCPVVDGTTGGADIEHGGITAVPVPDYYPEPNATSGPGDYSGNKSESISTTYAYYEDYQSEGITVWYLQAYSTTDPTTTVDGTACLPFADLILFAPYDASHTLPTGTFEFNNSQQTGTAYAGFRDDEQQSVGGSMFYFVNKSYLQQGYLDPYAQWLLTEGSLEITNSGWNASSTALNGSSIHIAGTSAIQVRGAASTPARKVVRR